MNLYVERVDARGLYRLDLSVEIKTLVLSQADWGVLFFRSTENGKCCACPRQRGGGAYIECVPASLMPRLKWVLITRLNAYLNTKTVCPLLLIKERKRPRY